MIDLLAFVVRFVALITIITAKKKKKIWSNGISSFLMMEVKLNSGGKRYGESGVNPRCICENKW